MQITITLLPAGSAWLARRLSLPNRAINNALRLCLERGDAERLAEQLGLPEELGPERGGLCELPRARHWRLQLRRGLGRRSGCQRCRLGYQAEEELLWLCEWWRPAAATPDVRRRGSRTRTPSRR
jgi:hypothetical protein